MRWLKPTLHSLYGMLGQGPVQAGAHADRRTEAVRQSMLVLLTIDGCQPLHHEVVRRVLHATDVRALWYLRSDLMVVLAAEGGEAGAHTQMVGITRMFDGLLPAAKERRKAVRRR